MKANKMFFSFLAFNGDYYKKNYPMQKSALGNSKVKLL
jgi:hypothetical protein